MDNQLYEMVSDYAFRLLDEKEGDPFALAEPIKNFVILYSVQGIIDNGGVEYLFESNLPFRCCYEVIIDAYKAINCIEQAGILKMIVNTFSFSNPHTEAESRVNFINQHKKTHAGFWENADQSICGNEDIWKKLNEYVIKNKTYFLS